MPEHCHRCQSELPAAYSEDGPSLFCMRCGAPQLRLPEHLRIPEAGGATTTGTLPPPRPLEAGSSASGIDWKVAVRCGALVGIVSAILAVLSLKVTFLSLPCFLWTIGGAIIALGLYARSRPTARMSAAVGLRIGTATGVLMNACLLFAFAIAGPFLRFRAHGLSDFDAQLTEQIAGREEGMKQTTAGEPPDVQAKMTGFINFLKAPEARSGFVLAGAALQGCVLLLLAAGGGSFSGMLRAHGAPGRQPR